MKKFYYAKNSEKYGPFSLEELSARDIYPDTLVWFEKLPSWQYARDVEELQTLFNPPNLPEIEQVEPTVLDFHTDGISTKEEDTQSFSQTPPIEEKTNYQEYILDNTGYFNRPFRLKGRIRRTEWWVSSFFGNICVAIISAITESIRNHPSNWFAILLFIALVWFIFAQGVKRCHDRGNSGWFMLIPFYSLWMAFGDSEIGANQYGTNPKGKEF